mgnify:CR=1 FL=1
MTYRKAKDADVAWVGCDVLEIDKDGLLTGKTINKGTRKRQNISLETYVINRKELLESMKKAHKIFCFLWFKRYSRIFMWWKTNSYLWI